MPSTDPGFVSARPRFKVHDTLEPKLAESLQECQIHLPANGIASMELRLVNWGPGGSENRPDFMFQTLGLGDGLTVLLGEDSDPPAFEGEITALEERYGDGAPQLVVLAEDKLHRLARSRENRSHSDTTLDAVIQSCAQEAGLTADAAAGSDSGTWLQVNESHLAFLQRLLAPRAIPLRLQDGALRARPEESDSTPLVLNPGGTAQRIRILADLNHQPISVRSAGWNLATGEAVQEDADALQPAPSGQSAATKLGDLGWAGTSTLPHPMPRTQAEAEAQAKGGFAWRARRFLAGEILCRDAATLRGGKEVRLDGVSDRLKGVYRVMDCWHLFDLADGLRTRLRVERPDWSV